MKTITIKCSCCGSKVAEIIDGVLRIKARHHGQTHTTEIAVFPLLTSQKQTIGDDSATQPGKDVVQ